MFYIYMLVRRNLGIYYFFRYYELQGVVFILSFDCYGVVKILYHLFYCCQICCFNEVNLEDCLGIFFFIFFMMVEQPCKSPFVELKYPTILVPILRNTSFSFYRFFEPQIVYSYYHFQPFSFPVVVPAWYEVYVGFTCLKALLIFSDFGSLCLFLSFLTSDLFDNITPIPIRLTHNFPSPFSIINALYPDVGVVFVIRSLWVPVCSFRVWVLPCS